ncbi:Probable xyloglucan galactosyltransferase GT12 [Linum perenne]
MCPSISNLGLGTRVKDHGGDKVLTEGVISIWGYNATTRDALGVQLVQWLRNQPKWNNNGMWGRDHFFISRRIACDLRRDDISQWGSKLMMLLESMNMTLLTVETTSWSNDFAVPYPSYFHHTTANQVHQWQERIKIHERR